MSRLPIREAGPERVIPPGRLGYDLMADRLLLHTVQTAEAFAVLRAIGALAPDPSRAVPEFADGYDWMYRQMAARLGTRGDGALWLWARIRCDDLLRECRRSRGEVLLTCRVSRELMLLSHFADWRVEPQSGAVEMAW